MSIFRKKKQVVGEVFDDYRVGDKVESNRALLVQENGLCAVCENGVVIWTGDTSEFSSLIRGAARRAVSVG